MRELFYFLFLIFLLPSCHHPGAPPVRHNGLTDSLFSGANNPLIPGYYADPSVIIHEGTCYVYATIDPWGSFELAVWESSDLQEWTLRRLNWPTIIRCHSETSDESMLTAPSVVKGKDNRFYMYLSAGNEIWAGSSEHPLGPWYSLLPDNVPLVKNEEGKYNFGPECFIDDDSTAYLYWGSGKGWEQGHCMAAPLNPDMASFAANPVEITPDNYREAPFVFRRNDQYYMFYSGGRCIDSTYDIRYARSDSPMGPWQEDDSSPLMQSEYGRGIIGPGHPSLLMRNDKMYLFYAALWDYEDYRVLRQVCMDEIRFTPRQEPEVLETMKKTPVKGDIRIQEASSRLSLQYPAEAAIDGLNGTLWVAAEEDSSPVLTFDLGKQQEVQTIYLWFEYALGVYQYLLEYSEDGQHWREYADAYDSTQRGAPRFHSKFVEARYIRITFSRAGIARLRPAIWEITFESVRL